MLYNSYMSKSKDKQIELEFEGQREDEELIFVFRRHIIAMRKGFYWLLIPLVIASIPFLVLQDTLWLLYLPIGAFLIGLIMFFYHFLMWFYSYYIVTNQRIRQVTQLGLFGKDVVELKLSKIQNISYNIPGFSGELFKFGTIIIQTFVGDLVIRNVSYPDRVYNKLQDAVDAATPDLKENDEVTEI